MQVGPVFGYATYDELIEQCTSGLALLSTLDAPGRMSCAINALIELSPSPFLHALTELVNASSDESDYGRDFMDEVQQHLHTVLRDGFMAEAADNDGALFAWLTNDSPYGDGPDRLFSGDLSVWASQLDLNETDALKVIAVADDIGMLAADVDAVATGTSEPLPLIYARGQLTLPALYERGLQLFRSRLVASQEEQATNTEAA